MKNTMQSTLTQYKQAQQTVEQEYRRQSPLFLDEEKELAVTNALAKFSKRGGFTQSMNTKNRQSKSTAGTTMDLNKQTRGAV